MPNAIQNIMALTVTNITHNKLSALLLSLCFAQNSPSSEFPPSCIAYNIVKQMVWWIMNNNTSWLFVLWCVFFFPPREALQAMANTQYNTYCLKCTRRLASLALSVLGKLFHFFFCRSLFLSQSLSIHTHSCVYKYMKKYVCMCISIHIYVFILYVK